VQEATRRSVAKRRQNAAALDGTGDPEDRNRRLCGAQHANDVDAVAISEPEVHDDDFGPMRPE
jgi:hypothetical protein